MRKSLQTSEWILSGSLILILISLFLISRFHEHRKKNLTASFLPQTERLVEVTISGEVMRPGVFMARQGTRLGDWIKKSRPKRFADLRGIDLDRPVEAAVSLEISRLNEIAVSIKGAVLEPVELKLPSGSRVSDLKSKIQCDIDADPRFFKRKRLLNDGEVILIPRRVREQELD